MTKEKQKKRKTNLGQHTAAVSLGSSVAIFTPESLPDVKLPAWPAVTVATVFQLYGQCRPGE